MNITKTGNKLTLEIDLAPEPSAPPTKTGKNKMAFTTGGFTYQEGLGIAINIIYPKVKR